MSAVGIGPFVFDAGRLAAVGALLVFSVLAGLLGRRRAGIEAWATWAILGWLIGARVGFVALNWADFTGQPLDALRVWQGGFNARTGWFAGGAVLAVAALRGRHHVLRPLVIAAAVTGVAHQAAVSALPRPAMTLPTMRLMAMDGSAVQIAGRDKVVVLNLWATWCPPCRREMPMMTELAAELPEIDFLFANQGESADRISDFLTDESLPSSGMLRDPSSHLMGRLRAVGMPTTLVFDARGTLTGSHTGEISRAALRGLIDNAKEKR